MQQRMPLPRILFLLACGLCLALADSAPLAQNEEDHGTLELDRSFVFRFECPASHGDMFAVDYLPSVWRRVNVSLDRLKGRLSLQRCTAGVARTQSCLTVVGALASSPGDDFTAYEISVQLHGSSRGSPLAAERAAFTEEAGTARADIEAIEGIADCVRIGVTAWARGGGQPGVGCGSADTGGCRSPAEAAAAAAGIVVALMSVAVLGAVLLARRRHRRQQQQQPQTQQQQGDAAEDQTPQLRHRDRQRQLLQQQKRGSAVSIVGPPEPRSQLACGGDLSWLNLAYQPDQDLPSRLTRFRGGEPSRCADADEAAKHFARIGEAAGGDPDAFYRVDGVGVSSAFVLASSAAGSSPGSVERLLELLWSCGGVAVCMDAGLAERLAAASSGGVGGRFHLTGWEAQTFPCHRLVSATLHCLDTNLSKRLRICEFSGRWSPEEEGGGGSDGGAPASRAEFVRFARACSDHLAEAGAAPVASLGPGLSAASLLPAFLLAAEQVQQSHSCDLLRLTARMRLQCPAAVASQQHYLFIVYCLHAYAFLLKRNSI